MDSVKPTITTKAHTRQPTTRDHTCTHCHHRFRLFRFENDLCGSCVYRHKIADKRKLNVADVDGFLCCSDCGLASTAYPAENGYRCSKCREIRRGSEYLQESKRQSSMDLRNHDSVKPSKKRLRPYDKQNEGTQIRYTGHMDDLKPTTRKDIVRHKYSTTAPKSPILSDNYFKQLQETIEKSRLIEMNKHLVKICIQPKRLKYGKFKPTKISLESCIHVPPLANFQFFKKQCIQTLQSIRQTVIGLPVPEE